MELTVVSSQLFNTPITLDKDLSKFRKIGTEHSNSLQDKVQSAKNEGRVAMDMDQLGKLAKVFSMLKTYVVRVWAWQSAVNTHCEPCNNRVYSATS